MPQFHVLIPCAGSGSRMQSQLPKQYLPLNGLPLLRHAIDCFESMDDITSIHVVIAADDQNWQTEFISNCDKTNVIIAGGDTRASTVLNGLSYLLTQVAHDDWVLVHDAARPGITVDLVKPLINITNTDSCGGLLALPLADTLKRSDQWSRSIDTVSRAQLWMAQTPQMFRLGDLHGALTDNIDRQPTDEAQAMEWAGFQPQLVLGDLRNLKVTYPKDLSIVAALLHNPQPSQGSSDDTV